jgi:hypothetical protein
MTYAFSQLFVGIALAIVLILPANRRQLSFRSVPYGRLRSLSGLASSPSSLWRKGGWGCHLA